MAPPAPHPAPGQSRGVLSLGSPLTRQQEVQNPGVVTPSRTPRKRVFLHQRFEEEET